MMKYVIRTFLMTVLLTSISASAQQIDRSIPERFPEQSEIISLYKAGKYKEANSRLLAVINSKADPDQKVTAFTMLYSMRKFDPAFDISVSDKAFVVIEKLYPDVSSKQQYSIDYYRVEREKIMGNWDGAAQAAQRMREKYEKKTDGTLMVYSEEPVLLCRAGGKKQAIDLVEKTWLRYPNNYHRNEAVRLNLAVYLSDTDDFDTAFKLVNELKESFPEEFKSSPYGVQNWVNYATRAKLADDKKESKRKLLEIVDFAQSQIGSSKYERVRDKMHYGIACLLEKAGDIASAKQSYKLAIKAQGKGPMGENIRKWSQQSIKFIDSPKQSSSQPLDDVQIKRSYKGRLIVTLATLCMLIIAAIVVYRRKRGTA